VAFSANFNSFSEDETADRVHRMVQQRPCFESDRQGLAAAPGGVRGTPENDGERREEKGGQREETEEGRTGLIRFSRQGIRTEGEGSTQLTSLY